MREIPLVVLANMSRPMNMLRTRRKDCNVKPNRRLDRKSSRGMLFENEELRLKTININAEVESREFDIKKLRRENEMLKKGIWYIRDEYDKLERLIKDKKIEFSSSSTTCTSSSDSESCSSCSEESEEVEETQNIRNVQRTNMKNFQDQFDHLSVVQEENSAENSEQSSNRTSLSKEAWKNQQSNIIKPDQSYPVYSSLAKSQTLPTPDHTTHFFSPIKPSRSLDDNHFNQIHDTLYPEEFYGDKISGNHVDIQRHTQSEIGFDDANFQHEPTCELYINQQLVHNKMNNLYNPVTGLTTEEQQGVKSLSKASTDLIVKIDNKNFNNGTVFSNTPSHSTFSNGGNLEELLNDIESISQRGMGNQIGQTDGVFGRESHDFMQNIQREDLTYMQNPIMNHLVNESRTGLAEKPYKSELNVVLMPNPMPLIGFEKYEEIKRSLESVNSKPIEELSASQQNLCVICPPPPQMEQFQGTPTPIVNIENTTSKSNGEEFGSNPFFFGNLNDNYVNADYFSRRYNPDTFNTKMGHQEDIGKSDPKLGSKANLLDLTSSEHVSSENEENLKFKTSRPTPNEDKSQPLLSDQPKESSKSSKMSFGKKVSIHFKAKKDKSKKTSEPSTPKIPNEKKHSIFGEKDKSKISHQKTPSIESKKSTTETSNQEPKTPTSSDSKTSNDKRNPNDKKLRKSSSLSPERTKHVHMKDEGGGKKHKKHKKGERGRIRRSSVLIDPRTLRERSFSVCTDRSNTMEHRLGLGLGFGSSFLYDDYSDGGRTNSLSSCDTAENARKMSTISNVPLSGKLPWCGCWGNGCL